MKRISLRLAALGTTNNLKLGANLGWLLVAGRLYGLWVKPAVVAAASAITIPKPELIKPRDPPVSASQGGDPRRMRSVSGRELPSSKVQTKQVWRFDSYEMVNKHTS